MVSTEKEQNHLGDINNNYLMNMYNSVPGLQSSEEWCVCVNVRA